MMSLSDDERLLLDLVPEGQSKGNQTWHRSARGSRIVLTELSTIPGKQDNDPSATRHNLARPPNAKRAAGGLRGRNQPANQPVVSGRERSDDSADSNEGARGQRRRFRQSERRPPAAPYRCRVDHHLHRKSVVHHS